MILQEILAYAFELLFILSFEHLDVLHDHEVALGIFVLLHVHSHGKLHLHGFHDLLDLLLHQLQLVVQEATSLVQPFHES